MLGHKIKLVKRTLKEIRSIIYHIGTLVHINVLTHTHMYICPYTYMLGSVIY